MTKSPRMENDMYPVFRTSLHEWNNYVIQTFQATPHNSANDPPKAQLRGVALSFSPPRSETGYSSTHPELSPSLSERQKIHKQWGCCKNEFCNSPFSCWPGFGFGLYNFSKKHFGQWIQSITIPLAISCLFQRVTHRQVVRPSGSCSAL